MDVPNVRRQEYQLVSALSRLVSYTALTNRLQLDVTDDGFLSLMSDDGSTKDDVKLPDGEVGDKINKLFVEDGKDTSKFNAHAK